MEADVCFLFFTFYVSSQKAKENVILRINYSMGQAFGAKKQQQKKGRVRKYSQTIHLCSFSFTDKKQREIKNQYMFNH